MNQRRYSAVRTFGLLLYAVLYGVYIFIGANGLPNYLTGMILLIDLAVGLVVACTVYGFYALFSRERSERRRRRECWRRSSRTATRSLLILFGIGFTNLMLQQNLLRKVIGFNIMDSAVFLLLASLGGILTGASRPSWGTGASTRCTSIRFPSGLVLTGIVVSVSITAFSLALIQRIYRRYGTIEMRELLERAKKEDD